jgi:cytochrome c-type biogenesis protein CcmH/NrfF
MEFWFPLLLLLLGATLIYRMNERKPRRRVYTTQEMLSHQHN